jgi:ribosomal protein S18 acetylase RimI-like enzyme
MTIEIRPMEKKDFDEVVSLFITAFTDAALYKYLAPDRDERLAVMKDAFNFRIKRILENGITDAAIEDGVILGMGAWEPPGEEMDIDQAVDLLKTPLKTHSAAVQERWEHFHRVLFTAFTEVIKQPFWDIGPIAVRPEAQGKGAASALLRKRLTDIDKAKLPCLLGTQDEKNLAIYDHYGFKLVRKDQVAENLFTYTMVRGQRREE